MTLESVQPGTTLLELHRPGCSWEVQERGRGEEASDLGDVGIVIPYSVAKLHTPTWMELVRKRKPVEHEDYLNSMRTRPPTKQQWGGFPEGVVIAHCFQL